MRSNEAKNTSATHPPNHNATAQPSRSLDHPNLSLGKKRIHIHPALCPRRRTWGGDGGASTLKIVIMAGIHSTIQPDGAAPPSSAALRRRCGTAWQALGTSLASEPSKANQYNCEVAALDPKRPRGQTRHIACFRVRCLADGVSTSPGSRERARACPALLGVRFGGGVMVVVLVWP